MRSLLTFASLAVLAISVPVSAQSHTFTFEDGTDQGWGNGFGNDASATFAINTIGGSQRMALPQSSAFQEAGREVSNPAETFFQAMLAASGNEAGYELSYDWYVDTTLTPGANGNFLQLATYVNSGSGYYAQDFPATGKDVELNGTQLGSGQVFSGTVTETFAAKGFNIPAGETFFRIGFIANGDGTPVIHLDNISVRPIVPEPASLAAIAMGGLLLRRRRA